MFNLFHFLFFSFITVISCNTVRQIFPMSYTHKFHFPTIRSLHVSKFNSFTLCPLLSPPQPYVVPPPHTHPNHTPFPHNRSSTPSMPFHTHSLSPSTPPHPRLPAPDKDPFSYLLLFRYRPTPVPYAPCCPSLPTTFPNSPTAPSRSKAFGYSPEAL
ncbi:hypothetical protein QBC32DRAFT_351864 [Pseudoneurospora amorphoporcata]|uniref:Uncharacterized protein n=1 Tax=Pseudoneurospora amorphoporcata TaxID=241081 RepID=A0AAN6SCX2_9PEZI|nr:hypothetical protein QBC32DRAFT_351864 [Pseudoneurospora amorphoporcata]